MSDCEKVLTYEEAKQMCMKAFDGGATYGSESIRYGVNAIAYDWEHWLKKNESLFKPKPTVEDVLREFADAVLEWAGKEWKRCRSRYMERRCRRVRRKAPTGRGGGRMIPFICGFVIGGMFGAVAMALCAVGGDSLSVPRVIVADEETDCATGLCTCGNCGEPIDPWDAWCCWCGVRLEDE